MEKKNCNFKVVKQGEWSDEKRKQEMRRWPRRTIIRREIMNALNNPKFKMRTIEGIASETHLGKRVVAKALRSDESLFKTVKIIPILSKDGKVLITTKDRFAKEATFKEKFIDFFASNRVKVEDVGE